MRLFSGSVACARTLLARPSASLLPAPRLFARASSSSSSATTPLMEALGKVMYTDVSPDAARAASSDEARAEAHFAARPLRGMPVPPSPTTEGRKHAFSTPDRAVPQGPGNVAMLYKQLTATLNKNQVRRELALGERYEKPNQERRRKRSERHRRRFKDLVRQKVQLVSALPPRMSRPRLCVALRS
jgi:small subunit ribosomal protein MRP21